MPSYNKFIGVGRLTRDPEVQYLPSGTATATLGLAVDDSYKNKEGEMVERTCFVDIVVWARQAETCAEYLHKGSSVLIEGSLQLDQWENKEGEKRSKLKVRASRVQFLDSKPKEEREPEQRREPAAPAEPEPNMSTPLADDDGLPF